MRRRVPISGYQAMWLFALFDLPVVSKEARREYARFRKLLLKEGFVMLQFSVYARYCPDEEGAEAYKKRVRVGLPKKGQVRLLMVTERQFGKQEVFYGEKRGAHEEATPQLMLF